MPEGDSTEQVESFLKRGGTHWHAEMDEEHLGGTAGLWIWPLADRVIANDDDLPYAAFQVHGRLRSGSRPPNETFYIASQVDGHVSMREVHIMDETIDSLHRFSFDARQLAGKGAVQIRCYATPSQDKPCSNILFLSVEMTPPTPSARRP